MGNQSVIVKKRLGKYSDYYLMRWQENQLVFFRLDDTNGSQLQESDQPLGATYSYDIVLHADQIRKIRLTEPEDPFDALLVHIRFERGMRQFYVGESYAENCVKMLREFAIQNGVFLDEGSLTNVREAEQNEDRSSRLMLPVFGLWILAVAALVTGYNVEKQKLIFSWLPLAPSLLLFAMQLIFPNCATLSENRRTVVGKVRIVVPMACFNLLASLFVFQYHFIDWKRLLMLAAGTFAAMFILYLLRVREWKRKPTLLVTAAILLAWCSVVTVGGVNVALDTNEPRMIETVIQKPLNADDRVYLEIDGERVKIGVSETEFDNLRQGDPMNVRVYSGALGIRTVIRAQ